MQMQRWTAAVAVGVVCVAITGCGLGAPAVGGDAAGLTITGKVHGGQQAVSGSVITLYRAGGTGYSSDATPLTTTTTDVSGNFSLTGAYTCGNATDQMYITSVGGNPGLTAGTNNPALVMMAALGNCGNLSSSTYIFIDEVTTVAAAWSLAQFATSAAKIGTSSTNATGLANAMLDAQVLANTTTGLAATLDATRTIETQKLYSLADAIAPCINSSGGAACTPLFTAATPSGGTAPTDTLTAALNIVKNPANNVAAVYACIAATPPYTNTLSTAPHDWTITMTATGGGMNSPESLDVDSLGNVWVTNYGGNVSGGVSGLVGFSPQGVAFSSTPYGSTLVNESYGLAIDQSNNIWVTNQQAPSHNPTQGSLTKFAGVSSGTTLGSVIQSSNPNGYIHNGTYNANYFYEQTIDFPESISIDTNNDVVIGNYGNSTATVYANNGQVVVGGGGSGNASFPVAIAADSANGMWLANFGDNSVTHLSSTGALQARPSGCCNGANGVAVDSAGNAWVANYYNASVSVIAAAGSVTVNQQSGGGLYYPAGLSVDGNQNVWVASYHGASISEFAGIRSSSALGTPLSPANPVYDSNNTLLYTAGYGLDAGLSNPYTVKPDASGNLWVSNNATNSVTVFFGLATPTATPTRPTPAIP